MDYKYYEKKINDIILKCPIEAGVEILVYNLLDSILISEELSLVDINRIRKNRDERLMTDAGIPDIAILSSDFIYNTEMGKVYGFIEVKATNIALSETGQVQGQKTAARHYLYTNGLVWKYFKDGGCEWECSLVYFESKKCEKITIFQPVSINKGDFTELKNRLNEIKWKMV